MEKVRPGGLAWWVLSAVSKLQDAYGVPIHKAVEDGLGRKVAIGAIYVQLGRLEQSALVSSVTGSPEARVGGRAKRYYRITEKGAEALQVASDEIERLSKLPFSS